MLVQTRKPDKCRSARHEHSSGSPVPLPADDRHARLHDGCAALAWPLIAPRIDGETGGGYDAARMVLLYATLPRLATALVAGAALSLSGALFQQVLRNPLASPTTLGISAGANLALVIALLFFPALLGFGRDLVALIEVADAAEEQKIDNRTAIEIRWPHRKDAAPGTSKLLQDAIMALPEPGRDDDLFVWASCEFSAFKAIRAHVRKRWGLAREKHLVTSYWRLGMANDDAEGLEPDDA